MNMKKISKLMLLAFASLALFSCGGGGGSSEPSYYLSDLQGLWQDHKDTTHYVRFTKEQSDEPNYLYGREWTEGDDVYESDLYKWTYTEDSLHIDTIRIDTIPLAAPDSFKLDTIKVDTMILVRDSALVPTYGNGWFKYWLETKGDLHEIHLMDNAGAEIPKEYVVSYLSSTRLEYYEKDRSNNRFVFSKMVEIQPANKPRKK